jgi:hypothetical protein
LGQTSFSDFDFIGIRNYFEEGTREEEETNEKEKGEMRG